MQRTLLDSVYAAVNPLAVNLSDAPWCYQLFFKRFAGVLTTNELRIESMWNGKVQSPFFLVLTSFNRVEGERLMSFICVPDCEPI